MALQQQVADIDGFREALGSFATSVNVITTVDPEGNACGMTATAFSSVSTEPLLILVCVNRDTRTYEYIAGSGRFAVNILGAEARELSDYCSRPGADKGLDPKWLQHDARWGSPALSGALVVLDCAVEQDVIAGTHAVLIGRVLTLAVNKGLEHQQPLLYFRGAYRQMQETVGARRLEPLPIVLEEF